jgi:uncharacterized repeat protein (TIGR01451 family)
MRKEGGPIMRGLAIVAAVASLAAFGHPAECRGAEAASVVLEATAETEVRVVNEKGDVEVVRVEARRVVPGDVVIYTVRCTNLGSEAVENVVVTNPIPQHMTYVGGTADGIDATITFSVDGGETYGQPSALTITDEEHEERPAVASEYTHIRWEFRTPLAPHERRLVSYRARLS